MGNTDDIFTEARTIGFGEANFTFAVFIANQPNMFEYQQLSRLMPLTSGEINSINQACGNGWRKVFNVYAKVLYALDKDIFSFSTLAPTWQLYRDKFLLQAGSKTALVFNQPPLLNTISHNEAIRIICGRTYAKDLIKNNKLQANFIWLDDEFAIDKVHNIIVCPYFDYRQLSNVKIERLSRLITILNLSSG
jgi:hypothetical protein